MFANCGMPNSAGLLVAALHEVCDTTRINEKKEKKKKKKEKIEFLKAINKTTAKKKCEWTISQTFLQQRWQEYPPTSKRNIFQWQFDMRKKTAAKICMCTLRQKKKKKKEKKRKKEKRKISRMLLTSALATRWYEEIHAASCMAKKENWVEGIVSRNCQNFAKRQSKIFYHLMSNCMLNWSPLINRTQWKFF